MTPDTFLSILRSHEMTPRSRFEMKHDVTTDPVLGPLCHELNRIHAPVRGYFQRCLNDPKMLMALKPMVGDLLDQQPDHPYPKTVASRDAYLLLADRLVTSPYQSPNSKLLASALRQAGAKLNELVQGNDAHVLSFVESTLGRPDRRRGVKILPFQNFHFNEDVLQVVHNPLVKCFEEYLSTSRVAQGLWRRAVRETCGSETERRVLERMQVLVKRFVDGSLD